MASAYAAKLEDFLSSRYRKDLEKLAEEFPVKRSFYVDYSELDRHDAEIADELIKKPYAIIEAAQEAISQMGLATVDGADFLPHVRFFNLPKEKSILVRNINSEHINTFLSAEGVITKITEVRPKMMTASFECRHCGRIYNLEQKDQMGKLVEPAICTCERKNFQLSLDNSIFVDTQIAEIQEPIEILRGGEQAKKMIVWLQDDLTNQFIPGDKIEITGVLRLKTPKTHGAIYDKFVDSNNIVKLEREFEEIELGKEDLEQIKRLASDPRIYEKIVESIAPSIYGHKEIKEAIAMQLFGGTPGKQKPDGMKIRPDCHILLVGDPGCLIGDERIALGNGAIARMEDLGNYHLQKIDAQVLTGQGHNRDTATVFHSYPNQPIIEVVTETGKSIKGTHNHPLLTVKNRQRKWTRLDEIRPGDRLATVPRIKCTITAPAATSWKKSARKYGPKSRSTLPQKLTPDIAGFLGYAVGDGWNNGYRVCCVVNSEEQDLVPKLEMIIRKNFGLQPSVRTEKRRNKKPMTIVEMNDKDVAQNLLFLREKRVPKLVMASGNKAVSEFLAWLFEADGCVFSKGRGRRAVQLKAKDIELLRDVQMLLLRFGIHSRIVERNLQIRRANSIGLFAKHVGFKSEKKKTRLKKLVEDCAKLSRRTGKHLSERVVAVRPAGFADVYDVEVPKTHRFIANGIVSHNTAKTQLLRYVKDLAPKGIYVSGKSSSGAGLTASAEKDELAEGGWTLKAGALVLASGGIALIDEFDKMGDEDRSSMHEAMESQTISVAKAGMITTFKANTAILAAANPKYGRFDAYTQASEQFNIPVTIMSRFDLIFPIRDVLDEVRDKEMADHILIAHQVAGARLTKGYDKKAVEEAEKRILPTINSDLLRKYIAFARRETKPALTNEAMDKLKEFYLDLRKLSEKQQAMAITARYLEALVRLSEASAKGRLSQKVEIEDSERAIRLLKFCFREFGSDPETGKIDVDILATGTTKSRMDKMRTVFRIIKRLAGQYDEVQHEMILEEAKAGGVKPEDLDEILATLKRNGEIYSPRYGIYKPSEEK